MMSDLNMNHEKMSDFILLSLFGFSLVIKLRNFDFESHCNALICCDQKDMASDLDMSHGKMSDFILLSYFGFTLVIKLRKFDFESHCNALTCFDQNDMVADWDFVSFSLFWVHFSHKTENFQF